MLLAVIVLALLNALTLELFFVLLLIGFLVVTELTAPFNVTLEWRKRLKWIIALGLVPFLLGIFFAIVAVGWTVSSAGNAKRVDP